MDPLSIFLAVAIFVVGMVIHFAAIDMDRYRIVMYAREQGWKILERKPSTPGTESRWGAHFYRVKYRDKLGNIHRAILNTYMGGGVTITCDDVLESAPAAEVETTSIPVADPSDAELRAEVVRLRTRVSELEEKPGP